MAQVSTTKWRLGGPSFLNAPPHLSSPLLQHCVNSPNLPEGSLEYALKELPVCHGGQPRESGRSLRAIRLCVVNIIRKLAVLKLC